MAQAVFEDHPLADYLRDVGELGELMPGTSSELETEIDPFRTVFPNDEDDLETIAEWRPRLLIELLDILYAFLELIQPPKSPNPFAERFKYDIISSSLLSPTLQTPYHRSTRTPPIPGNLHSRNSSADTSSTFPPLPPPHATPQEPNYTTPSLLAIATAFFYLADHMFLTLVSLVAVAFSLRSLYIMNDSSKIDMTPCLTSLNELIGASDAWASIIQEAIANIELEEQSLLYGATFSSASPTSSIRVSLHSSLLTTQNQCDNVRQLFSALTSVTELSQLSEMYAPTSNKSNQPLPDSNSRPLSLPTSQSRPRLSDPRRLTWNGSYTTLADQVGPLPPFLRHREKRRSDMTSILQGLTPGTSRSAPVTPASNSPNGSISSKLASVREESISTTSLNTDSFGTTALSLQRSLKAEAADVFGTPPPKSHNRRSWMPSTISSTSRLSSIQSSRHPLSLPTLQNAIQSALASKRYACSHLLALRFTEDEDEAYWEDARSVMGLLTTTFSDASSRLLQALEECKASEVSPTLSSEQDDSAHGLGQDLTPQVSRKISESFSFAPMPGPFSRFAEHVAAVSSAMDNAKEHLESCVSLLKDDHGASSPSNISIQIENLHGEHPALQAYERLRRELGLTLRECERGRERLLEIVKPRADPTAHDSDSDDVPLLGHDVSDYSDKPGPRSLSDGEEDDMVMDRVSIAVFLEGKINDGEPGHEKDDATENLLLSASPHHLPPMLGIEQVFEAETAVMDGFIRERSKMSREERIKLVKARREKTVTSRHRDCLSDSREDADGDNEGGEKWGPGGEVVQELKDVIWKVGERRRKFANELHRHSIDVSTPVQTPVDADNDTLPTFLDGDAKGSLGTKGGS
ncbi:hypothetical protein F5887DRAFT_987397 [Amanita rubescens]|nr:hypothetical protein F5887DRAFT_987397 [Amanita rubescens]